MTETERPARSPEPQLSRKPWRLRARVEYKARKGPHGPDVVQWSAQRDDTFVRLDDALAALADLAAEIAAHPHRLSGRVEVLRDGARLLLIPLGRTRAVAASEAIDRLEAICAVAGRLLGHLDPVGTQVFRDRATGEVLRQRDYYDGDIPFDYRPGGEYVRPPGRRYVVVAVEDGGDTVLLDPVDG